MTPKATNYLFLIIGPKSYIKITYKSIHTTQHKSRYILISQIKKLLIVPSTKDKVQGARCKVVINNNFIKTPGGKTHTSAKQPSLQCLKYTIHYTITRYTIHNT